MGSQATSVVLRLAMLEEMEALRTDRATLGLMLDSPIPDRWPEFPEAIDFTLSTLRSRAGRHGWSMHFFMDEATGELIGSGGYVSVPKDGMVEIGYEVAPAYRGRGFGRAAAAALVSKAESRGVRVVTAHTLAAVSPSTRVLESLGFTRGADAREADGSRLWYWARH